MKFLFVVLLSVIAIAFVGVTVEGAPANPWLPFKLGLITEAVRTAEATVEDIDFQIEEPQYDTPRLLAFFNLKNVSDRTRRFSVSFALFGESRELLCSAPPRAPELRVRASQTLKVDFGECGHGYAKAMRIRFFQVAIFSPETKR